MTLEQLESTLPNGLHDAEVKRIIVDYDLRQITMDIAVWVGGVDDPPKTREIYKNARLSISGLLFVVMEPPDPKYPFKSAQLTIDTCDVRKNLHGELLESLPADSFFQSLWVNEWNAFIHIAAKEAQISWLS